jgi:amino acid adenylation domain-containing protein
MLEQFGGLLAQIVDNPGAKVGDYSLMTAARVRLLPDPTESLDSGWNGPIHEHFTRWANCTPDQIALFDDKEAWTYRELENLSARLASRLIRSGVRPNDFIAIYAHRSAPLVVALLGILKAGAAFVILDPAYPAARLSAYLRIARPKGWIQLDAAGEVAGELADSLEVNVSCRVALPKGKAGIADVFGDSPISEMAVAVGANDPAYIGFTSGSTGEPKGVVCRHGPVTHFLPWQKETFDLCGTDRFCLLSGLAYSHLHRDIFTALYLGATLYVPEPDTARSPKKLAEWLDQNEINVLHLTPALGQLLTTARDKKLPSVRRIFFGGDVLTRQDITNIRDLAPNAKIGSFYGATETQRAVGCYLVPDDFEVAGSDGTRPIPLGRGIKDVQLLLLNAAGKLAGVGELAELYVRSPHLAEGYIGDEKLTAQRFLMNPFTNDPEDRLYRTGELGRYLPDGNIEWAGRTDRCVNIRGFRVELEEVESVLKQHPAVRDAAVVVQGFNGPDSDNPKSKIQNLKSDKRLVAYVAVGEEASDSLTDLLCGYLSALLPEYMVPPHLVILDRLPLSPNGKVDYRALPPVQQFLSVDPGVIQAPRNEVEAKLSAIFCRVLGQEQVGIEENFFRLGGHSLLAARAAAHIRDAFGVAFELRTFLEFPTVAALAKEIEVRIKPAADTSSSTDDTDREEIEL